MALASEELSWPPESSAFGKDDGDRGRRNPFGEVRDRSLSYLDVNNFREQVPNGRSQVFESVRKFGRPRQQISEVLDFLDPSLPSAVRGDRNSFCRERYHFGQCLVLPKVSTLPPKGKVGRHKWSHLPKKNSPPKGECYDFKNRDGAHFTLPIQLISSREGVPESETKMFRWMEIASENCAKNAYRNRPSFGPRGSSSPKSTGRSPDGKDFEEFYTENQVDVEALFGTRDSRDLDNENIFKDDCYRRSTIEGRIATRSIEDSEMRIFNIRENWKMRVTKENEEGRPAEQLAASRSKAEAESDADEDEIWVKPVVRETGAREEAGRKMDLSRSKSTPDMLEGIGGRKLEVWTQPKRKASLMDVAVKNWEEESSTIKMRAQTYLEAKVDSELVLVDLDDAKTREAQGHPSVDFLMVHRIQREHAHGGSARHLQFRAGAATSLVNNDEQEADSLNEPNSFQEPVSLPELSGNAKTRNSRFASGKNFFGQFLNSRGSTPTEMFSNTEPFSQFWVSLSNIYGQALVVIMLALSLTEVMDNSVKLLSLQGAFLIYLYVGSIAVIICIYIWVLIDSCSSIQKNDNSDLVAPTITTGIVQGRDAELQNLSATKFGSLKKAHITRDRTSNTSFYLRIGAIAFGLGTLVFNGLEMAMHSMMESSCLNDVIFVHPILHGLFTFLQMHFLFVNSQVLVERFGLTARFGFMHLAATNLALWIRLVIWESGNEWTYYVHLSQQEGADYPSTDIPTPLQLRGFPKLFAGKERTTLALGKSDNNVYQAVSKDHISQVVSLHECLNTNSLGRLWTSSMPFLYPFIIQFSLIAAVVTYIMGQNVAKNRVFFQKQKKAGATDKSLSFPTVDGDMNTWNVDCAGASKGLFLGILCLVAGVVVIIIFLVVKENEDFPPETIFWLTMGMLLAILSVTVLMNAVGLVQIRKLAVTGTKMTALDKILSVVSVLGVQLYTILGIVVGGSGAVEEARGDGSQEQKRHGMLLAVSVIQLLQSIMQSTFIVEGIRRTTLSRTQAVTKPARQVVTFLIFSNAVLWVFDTFIIQSWMSQELQLRFFGVLAWGALSRIGLPLLVFFRFHSCVLLLEIWKKSYHSLHLDTGN